MLSKNIIAKIAVVLLISATAMLPAISFASANGTYQTPSLWPSGFWGPIVWCTGNYLSNPQYVANTHPATCTNLCDLIGTAVNVIYLVMSIAIFIIAPIGILVGGITVMISGANPGLLETGKKILLGTVIGLVIVLCAYLIVNTFLYALNVTGVGSFNGNAGACQVSQ